jgi:hypothetical protein
MDTEMARSFSIRFSELRDAYEFVSASNDYEHHAYICINTGVIHCVSDQLDMEEDVPEDIGESDQYISVPHKNDLNLGRDLVFRFARHEMPGDWQTISDFFRRKGAYRRFRNFLESRDMVETWYRFEEASIDEALRAWCAENEIPLRDD